jgi:hypothetical protein
VRLHAARRHRKDHEVDRWRKQNAERSGRRDHAGAKALRIAMLDDCRKDDRADTDYGCDRRAGNRGKQGARDHAGQAKPAIPVADQRGRKRDHPPRDPSRSKKVARQDEERDSHDLEAIEAGEQLEADHLGIDTAQENK